MVQVSMNMVDYHTTSLVRVFSEIQKRAAHEGVQVAESEIVGLTPLEPLIEAAEAYFKLARFDRRQILETRLWE